MREAVIDYLGIDERQGIAQRLCDMRVYPAGLEVPAGVAGGDDA